MLDDEIDENDENAIEEFIGKFCCIFCLYTMICEKNKYDFQTTPILHGYSRKLVGNMRPLWRGSGMAKRPKQVLAK